MHLRLSTDVSPTRRTPSLGRILRCASRTAISKHGEFLIEASAISTLQRRTTTTSGGQPDSPTAMWVRADLGCTTRGTALLGDTSRLWFSFGHESHKTRGRPAAPARHVRSANDSSARASRRNRRRESRVTPEADRVPSRRPRVRAWPLTHPGRDVVTRRASRNRVTSNTTKPEASENLHFDNGIARRIGRRGPRSLAADGGHGRDDDGEENEAVKHGRYLGRMERQ